MWIVVVGALSAFCYAWAIGANDVANAFGTSVGAKTLTLMQACLVATVFELSGAVALGAAVTDTIASTIASPDVFAGYPEIFMYGMLCSTVAAAMWVTLATFLELAVSTTHSIIGAIVGFSLVWEGAGAVLWIERSDEVPFLRGVTAIVLSWVISPVISAILGAAIFLSTRTFILRRNNSAMKAFWCLPVLVLVTIFINVFFILYKGAGKTLRWPLYQCAWVAAAAAVGSAVITASVIMPLLMYRFSLYLLKMKRRRQPCNSSTPGGSDDTMEAALPAPSPNVICTNSSPPTRSTTTASSTIADSAATKHARISVELQQQAAVPTISQTMVGVWDNIIARAGAVESHALGPMQATWNKLQALKEKIKKAAFHGLVQDVHENLEDDEIVVAMHQAAELFDPETEHVFKYLQVFSACCVSFAHGSNDVANAVGPFAAIWYVYNNLRVPSKGTECPRWILAMGGAGMVLGLMTFGYRIIRALGVKMIKMTPSRGYCAELATALTVVVASSFGLPVSTTHCIVGAEAGVGMCENVVRGTNWRLVAKTASSWVFTLLLTALLSAAFFSQGVYAPSVIMAKSLHKYEGSLAVMGTENWDSVAASNNATKGYFDPNLTATAKAQRQYLRKTCLASQVYPENCLKYYKVSDVARKGISLLAAGYDVLAPNFTNASASIPSL